MTNGDFIRSISEGKLRNRKMAKARLKQIERQQIRKELDEYEL